jgi:serine/threonine protein kinase
MKGMAWALSCIHTFRVTKPQLNLVVGGGVRVLDNGILDVLGGEEKYGRHGDIKPENILWFEHGLDLPEIDEKGVLQITDFGLGRFHGRESRSGVDPRKVQSSLTYEPPECRLGRPVSRAYDLWSLGCLYLEFVTWLLKGAQAIHTFADARGKQEPLSIIDDDSFFTAFPPDSKNHTDAVVREDVVKWVAGLHAHRNCSKAIHDILDLVMDGLLKVNASERILSCHLCRAMNEIVRKAEASQDYLIRPAPREAQPVRIKPKKARFAESHTWPPERTPS